QARPWSPGAVSSVEDARRCERRGAGFVVDTRGIGSAPISCLPRQPEYAVHIASLLKLVLGHGRRPGGWYSIDIGDRVLHDVAVSERGQVDRPGPHNANPIVRRSHDARYSRVGIVRINGRKTVHAFRVVERQW